MPAVCRIGDPYNCGDTQAEGSGNVFANGIPVSRLGDKTAGHCYPASPIDDLTIPTVKVNDIEIAVVGSHHPDHTCGTSTHDGTVTSGSSNVFSG